MVHRLTLKSALAAVSVLLSCSACSLLPPTPAERTQYAQNLLHGAGWQSLHLAAGPYTLAAALSPRQAPGSTLTLYIEGDGLAWLNRSTPADDPTPIHPTGLQLALAHQQGPAAYLARPCQFVPGAHFAGCRQNDWTDARFAEAVIAAENQAIDTLKTQTGATRLILVGYSGGGAVAALVASRRQDVERLVTLAGNLDHVTWTQRHQIDPLSASLNPADAWRALARIPQVHFVGGRDQTVEGAIAAAYAARFPPPGPRILTEPQFDHACCWVEAWPRLQQEAFH